MVAGEGARAATAADLGAVVTLARAAIEELRPLRGGAVWHLQQARREPLEVHLSRDLSAAASEGCAVVGLWDDAVVGYGVSRCEALAGGEVLSVVTDLYVSPEARGVGIGEAMMDLLVDHARSVGAVGIDSLALPGDRSTKNFFETFGLKARAIVVHRSLDESATP